MRSRPLSDFRDNYRGTTGSKEDVDQFDVKLDWNASSKDKVYVRYSKQTSESGTSQTAIPLLFPSAASNPTWSVAGKAPAPTSASRSTHRYCSNRRFH